MVKEWIKTFLSNCINQYSRWVYRYRFPEENRAIIIVPSWEGNLGDEAVIDSITRQLKVDGFYVSLLHFGDHKEWAHLQYIDSWLPFPNYMHGRGYWERFKFAGILPLYNHLYLLGTDMLDGCYAEWLTLGLLTLTKQAAITGLKTTIVGFSINNWQVESCISMLVELKPYVRICVRDNVSIKRLGSKIGLDGLTLTADMAFLLQPSFKSQTSKPFLEWIIDRKKHENLLIGVNINPQLFKDQEKMLMLMRSYEKAILMVYSEYPNASFILLPHDFRIYNSDLILVNQLHARLEPKLKAQINVIDHQIMASDIKAIAGHLDIVVTGRMHISIACLGQGTPVGCVVYQGKFDGLFNHFNYFKPLMLTPEEALNQNKLAELFFILIRDKTIIADHIKSKLPDIKKLSLLNIKE